MEHRERLDKEIKLHQHVSQSYDERYRHRFSQLFHDRWNNLLVGMLAPKPTDRVLDIACGTGIFLESLVRKSGFVAGVDLSKDMIDRVQIKDPNLRALIVSDATRLPFPDESFDCVSCRGSLHHFPSLSAALEEIVRVLKPGGRFITSEPSRDSAIIRTARSLLYRTSDHFLEEDEGYFWRELRDALQAAGFEIAQFRRFGFFAYLFAGFPDIFKLPAKLPCNVPLTRAFIQVDRILAKIPLLNAQAFHLTVLARKR